jgi:replicative DNA helicase
MTVHKLHAGELAPRRPPHNLEAEQALLGAILLRNSAYERVSEFLRPADFYDPLHQRIYELVSTQIAAGRCADVVTIRHAVENLEPINKMTVPQYLHWLVGNAITTVNAREYGRTIRELSLRRQLISISEGMADAAYDSPVDFPAVDQITEAETRLYSLAQADKYGEGFRPFKQISATAIMTAANARKSGGGISGLATKFTDIDDKLGGLQPSDLVIAALTITGRIQRSGSASVSFALIVMARAPCDCITYPLRSRRRSFATSWASANGWNSPPRIWNGAES